MPSARSDLARRLAAGASDTIAVLGRAAMGTTGMGVVAMVVHARDGGRFTHLCWLPDARLRGRDEVRLLACWEGERPAEAEARAARLPGFEADARVAEAPALAA